MAGTGQKIGKIDVGIFNSFLQHRLGASDSSVLVPPRTGIDAGVISLGNGEVLIVAEDPIFAIPGQPLEMFGWYTVHIGASDVAVMGVSPRYMTYSLLLPPDTSDDDLKVIVNSIHEAAKELGIAIVGGHTGYYPGFAAPTIGGVTVFAIAKEDSYVTPAGAQPGDVVILTKGPAIETAGILSVLREKDLLEHYEPDLVKRAQALCSQMSVVRDAMTAIKAGGVTGMHDATEGGVIGGLFEIADASGVGMDIDESLFVYPPEVRMVCDHFGIDPIKAIAEGSLLITAHKEYSDSILTSLAEIGIVGSVIGMVTSNPENRMITRLDDTIVPLEVPAQDPFWPVFFESVS
ncbi:MAG TPA: AIR synthase family protein [Methanospirillum sp.]|uniref:AIR synthase family protein n=1 Tax=Methanospirillum sp. TaxID=45200 RepID=UPI002CC9AB04|nr:AIR synthase family protein [Methanospirillum sp.]HWQ63789.1 AIR synthase family protein [Methanospirillum sp.]